MTDQPSSPAKEEMTLEEAERWCIENYADVNWSDDAVTVEWYEGPEEGYPILRVVKFSCVGDTFLEAVQRAREGE